MVVEILAADTVPTSQVIIVAVLSSGLASAIVAFFSKKAWSPESKNELARLGNEFAQQLLKDARSERAELRATIHELETATIDHKGSIERLTRLVEEKDRVIHELEERRILIARKLQQGKAITLYDVFGDHTPEEFRENPSTAI